MPEGLLKEVSQQNGGGGSGREWQQEVEVEVLSTDREAARKGEPERWVVE